MISVTRRYRFSASHRLHSESLSPAENTRIYGKCNNPFGHGHDYILEITAAGQIDARTGLLLPIARLDRLVENEVLRLFTYRNINADIPQFASLVPTTENVALIIAELLQREWLTYFHDGNARLLRVHVQETGRNSFEVRLPAAIRNLTNHETIESRTINA